MLTLRHILKSILDGGGNLDDPVRVNGQPAVAVKIIDQPATCRQVTTVTTSPQLVEPDHATIIYNCSICLHEAEQTADTLVETGTAICPECDCDMEILRIKIQNEPDSI